MSERPEISKGSEFSLGEQFFPFAYDKSVKREPKINGIQVESYAFLKLPFNDLHPIKTSFWLYTCVSDGLEINPFHPELSYQIDSNDLDLEARKTKLLKAARTPNVNPLSPLYLSIFFSSPGLEKAGFVTIKDYEVTFTERNKSVLRTLNCLVSANGYYLSRGEPNLPETSVEDYYFIDFFPIDTGPLAADHWGTEHWEDRKVDAGEGHALFFSNNNDEIKKIGITFVINRLIPQEFVIEK